MEAKNFYEFGPFRLDPTQRVLWRAGERVPLHPKTFVLLETLLAANGQVISKDDLLARVWPDVVVEESNLTKNISLLRKALGNGAEAAELIETIPKVGYRFSGHCAPVADANSAATHNGAAMTLTPGADAGNKERKSTRGGFAVSRAGWFGIAALAALLAAGSVWLAFRQARGVRNESGPRPVAASVAVLPFQNLTGDAAQDFFADGLTENLTNDLSRIRDLTVIARNSAFTFKGQTVDARAAGQKLNVAAVLTGTVQRAGDDWQITATLQETESGRLLWRSEHHNRPLADIFPIEREIRCNVAANLQVVLCGTAADKKQTTNLEAYLGYLKGLYQFNLRTSESLRQAIKHFEQAVALDPNYAEGWATLADAYFVGRWYIPLSNEVMPKMGTAAQRAVVLDDSSAHAHFALAQYFSSQEQQTDSDREDERVMALNPNFPRFVHSQAITCALLGQYDKGIALIRQAQRLDPLSLVVNTDVGYVYYIARRYDEAIAAYRNALALDAKFSLAHLLLGLSLSQQGKHAEAVAEVQQAADRGSEYLAALGNVQARAGQHEAALKTLDQLQQLARQKYVPPYQFAWVYCGLGDRDRAVASLQESARQKTGVIDFKHHPIYEPLRGDARYEALLKQAAYPW